MVLALRLLPKQAEGSELHPIDLLDSATAASRESVPVIVGISPCKVHISIRALFSLVVRSFIGEYSPMSFPLRSSDYYSGEG